MYAPLVVLTVAFSIIPVFLEGETSFFVIALSIFYPFADLLVPFRSIFVMVALRKGTLIRPWGLISASFLCLSISDLAFSYADRNNLYWPGGAPNFISVGGDWLYIVFYVLVGLGVYFAPMVFGQSALQEVDEIEKVRPATRPIPMVGKSVFLSTHADGKIWYISTGAVEFFGMKDPAEYLNKSLSSLLMKSEDEISDLLRKISRWGTLSRQDKVGLPNDPGQMIPLKIYAVASRDENGKFIGADIFFSSLEAPKSTSEDRNSYLRELVKEEKAPEVKSGLGEQEDDIFWYFQSQVKVIYLLIARNAGIDIAGIVVSQVNEASTKSDWPIKMDPTSLEVINQLTGTTLEERTHIYRTLLRQIVDYAIAITSYSTTIRELHILDGSISEDLNRTIAIHGLRYPYTPPVTVKSTE
jgi:hypothetical protein